MNEENPKFDAIMLRAAMGDKEPLKAMLSDFTRMVIVRALPGLARERMSKRGYRRWRAKQWPALRERVARP